MQRWFEPLVWLGQHWNTVKTFIEHAFGFSHDALHVEIGVVLQVIFALVTRRSLGSFLPWAAVLLLEAANEWSDLTIERWPDFAMQLGESAKDMTLTVLLPTLLLGLVRCQPQIFRPRALSATDTSVEPDAGQTDEP